MRLAEGQVKSTLEMAKEIDALEKRRTRLLESLDATETALNALRIEMLNRIAPTNRTLPAMTASETRFNHVRTRLETLGQFKSHHIMSILGANRGAAREDLLSWIKAGLVRRTSFGTYEVLAADRK